MVHQAQERGCYDELAVGELVQYLSDAAAAVEQKGRDCKELYCSAVGSCMTLGVH
jgi:hypothetical protein